MKALLQLPEPPTGVILGNYDTMLGGIMALNESGLSCPEDISLIGFDDLLMSKVIRPKLWLLVQPMQEMCIKAIEMLLKRINGENEESPQKISYAASLREGNSIQKL